MEENKSEDREVASLSPQRRRDIAEDVAIVAVTEILDWVVESAKVSTNNYDDLFIAVMPLLKAAMLEQLDKIDGKVG